MASRWAFLIVVCAAALLSGCGAGMLLKSEEERLAIRLENEGKWRDAAPLREAALAEAERSHGPDDPRVADAITSLVQAMLQDAMYASMIEHRFESVRHRFIEAEALSRRALEIYERAGGPNDGRIVLPLTHLARAARFLDRPEEALAALTRALAVAEKAYGPLHARVSGVLFDLAELYESTERFAEEEPSLLRDIEVSKAAFGPDSLRFAESLQHLSSFYYNRQGRYDEARDLDRRALEIREKVLGHDNVAVGESLIGMAQSYLAQNLVDDARPLLQRALAIKEKALGPEHLDIAVIVGMLANVAYKQARYDEARALHARAIAIYAKKLGPRDINIAVVLSEIADIEQRQGKLGEAERLLVEARQIANDPPDRYALTLSHIDLSLADVYLESGRADEAERKAALALDHLARTYDPTHPPVIAARRTLSRAYLQSDRLERALDEAAKATSALSTRAQRTDARRNTGSLSERRDWRNTFVQFVSIADKLGRRRPERLTELETKAFETAQAAQATSTAQAVAGMAARLASGDDALAAAVRERQDLQERRRRLDARLVQAIGLPSRQRDAAQETEMRRELQEIDAAMDRLDARLARDFPEYAEIASTAPLPIAAVQKLLEPDEALLAYLVGSKDSFAWLIRADRQAFVRLDIGREELEEAVAELRAGLDPTRLDLMTLADIPAFDTTKAHAVYRRVFAPVERLLDGAQHVFVVPDAALQSLPLGVLITEETAPAAEMDDYRRVPWLARRYALTVLPAVSSLRALHTFASAGRATEPFAGFGDPEFDGAQGASRGMVASRLFRGGGVDVESVRRLPRLPETADELRAEAAALGAREDSVRLQGRATVTAVKQANLANVRVLAFATHGLIAGEIAGLAEPALALTPPRTPSPDDRGLLTASDVSRLKLNADWVVLSACNTAAPDGDGGGDGGAEGLSGLAKAFFYAGARSLLVSHWPVESRAAARLTTAAFKALQEEPSIGRAEALRRSMVAMIDGAGTGESPPQSAHPMFWAPFVLVGEGGARR